MIIKERHVLGFVENQNIPGLFGGRIQGQPVSNDVAQFGVGMGGGNVVFHRQRMEGVNVQVLQMGLVNLFFHFVPQHGIVGDLENLFVGEGVGDGQDGGGFARTRDGVDHDVLPRGHMIKNDLLFWTRFI